MSTATRQGAKALEDLLGTVGEAMTGEVVALAADLAADVALRRLEGAGVSGAPVVKAGRVVGVVTLRDLLASASVPPPVMTSGPFLRREHLLSRFRVAELMTFEPVTARADWPLGRAVLAMDEVGVNRLPVVDADGRPVGILTRDDVVSALARRLRTGGRAEGTAPEPEPPPRRPVILPD
jgi:CBS domain-containing membrane protein